MQAPNNNQGPRPPIPGASPQFRPQNGPLQPSQPAATSPFANPPPSSTGAAPVSNPVIRPPGQLPMRPPMASQQVPSSNNTPNFNRPPQVGIRPPIPNASNLPTSAAPPLMRPPIPQSPSTQGIRPPLVPQAGPAGLSQSSSSQNLRPSMPRPPLPQVSSNTRPPMPILQSPQAPSVSANRPPMPQVGAPLRPPSPQIPQVSAPPGPPLPHTPQAPVSSSFARPPVASPPQIPRPPMPAQPTLPNSQSQFGQMRPPIPGPQASVPAMRPPIPGPQTSVPAMRPPVPGTQASVPAMRPPMPSVQSTSPQIRPLAPPISTPQRPPIPGPNQPMNQIPPQTPTGLGPVFPTSSQSPGTRSPTMRYPPGPGYIQQPPTVHNQTQQPGYPQTMPPTQQPYPSYPETSRSHPSAQGYVGGSMGAQQPAAPKVNPAAIPSVVAVLEADETRFKESGQPFYTYSSIVDNPPPLPTNRSVSIIDDGNSSPQFIRSTLNHIPISEEICENTKIPLSLIIQPFSTSPQNEIPLVDFGPSGPLRCNRCRAYINPRVQFTHGGRYYVCNLCDMNNEVPDEYYANLDMSGKRIDLDLRPELKFGTVDFVASKEYLNKPVGKPHLLFVLDSSRAAVGSGAFQTALETIKAFASSSQAVKNYGGMAILTQDRTLTFYTLREGRNEPQVYVMGDVFDPFVPLHANDLYFDPAKCASGLSVLLNHLATTLTIDTRPVDSSFGAAVSVALESLKVRGGRAVFFQTALPSYGPGTLINRETGSNNPAATASSDKANPLLFPQGDFYSKLAIQAAENGVSMSIISTPAAHIDLATLGVLANTSSGTVLHYPRFTAQQHMNRVVGDVHGLLSSKFAFDCLARIRCSSGLQVKKHYGHFYAASNGHDLSFGTLSSDQSFAALLEYDGKLSEKERACFQVAFLYTDALSGQRRIRTLNLALPCTSSIQTIFRMAELDSILALYLKKNVSQILEAPAPAFPASFTAKCVNILAAYRRYCAANMSSGQLILPDSLKLFPIMTLAIHKDPAFNTSPMPIDSRWYFIHRLSDQSMSLTITHFYPQLFPLSNVLDHEEVLPACLRLSREHLNREGIYLMNNGNTLTLYIGDSVDPNTLKEIFGIPQLNGINLTGSNLPILQNARSAKIRQIITVLRSQNAPRYLNIRLIRQSVDIAEDAEFSSLLVEDASPLASSYVDFLCRAHSQIQHTISQGSTLSLAERTSILSFLQ